MFHRSLLAVAFIALLELIVMMRILLRPHRDPASRIAWIVVVAALPLMGMLAYLLLGEVNIGRGRVKRLRAVLKRMKQVPCHASGDATDCAATVPERYRHLIWGRWAVPDDRNTRLIKREGETHTGMAA